MVIPSRYRNLPVAQTCISSVLGRKVQSLKSDFSKCHSYILSTLQAWLLWIYGHRRIAKDTAKSELVLAHSPVQAEWNTPPLHCLAPVLPMLPTHTSQAAREGKTSSQPFPLTFLGHVQLLWMATKIKTIRKGEVHKTSVQAFWWVC